MLNLKILVVDDLALVRSLVRKSLSDLKLTNVQEAVDGIDAIQKIEEAQRSQSPYDVVFIDWNMPGKNGLEVVQQCKSDPQLKDIPFIMISAERDKARVVQALKAGVLDYVVKPFQPSLLISKLERISQVKRVG